MSDTELPTGRDSVERELGGRVPLPEWTPAPDESKEYARGDAGIVEAANDLDAMSVDRLKIRWIVVDRQAKA